MEYIGKKRNNILRNHISVMQYISYIIIAHTHMLNKWLSQYQYLS